MNTNLRSAALIWSVPVLLGIALAAGLTWPRPVVEQVVDEVARTRDEALPTRFERLFQDRGVHPWHVGRRHGIEHHVEREARLLTLGGGSA